MKDQNAEKYYSVDDFSSVEKIDMHVHLNSCTTGVIGLGEKFNYKQVLINTDVADEFPSNEEQHRVACAMRQQYPDRLNHITAFSMQGWEDEDWVDRTIKKLKADFADGAVAVKVWKNIGMIEKNKADQFIMIDDPRFDPVVDFIIQEGKAMAGHLGEPKNCWLPLEAMTVNNDWDYFSKHPEFHMYLHPEYPSYEAQIDARDRFLERHPDLRFIGCHLGTLEWSVDELAKRLDKFPNMAVDSAERLSHLQDQSQKDRERVRDFFIKYQDRIMYGSDFIEDSSITDMKSAREQWQKIWFNEWEYLVSDKEMTSERINGPFQGLHLPKDVVDKIYRHNIVRWLKLK